MSLNQLKNNFMPNKKVVSNFKKIQRLEVGYSSGIGVQQSMRLPKTLEHLSFYEVVFNSNAFLSDLTQLTSFELDCVSYVSNEMLAHIAKNFLELKSFKLGCECLINSLNLYLYGYR